MLTLTTSINTRRFPIILKGISRLVVLYPQKEILVLLEIPVRPKPERILTPYNSVFMKAPSKTPWSSHVDLIILILYKPTCELQSNERYVLYTFPTKEKQQISSLLTRENTKQAVICSWRQKNPINGIYNQSRWPNILKESINWIFV